MPNFGKDEYYMKEFAYIQFSDDFEKVQYGTEEQVRKQQKEKMDQINEEKTEGDEEADDAEVERKRKQAEKNKKKREKQKQKKLDEKL